MSLDPSTEWRGAVSKQQIKVKHKKMCIVLYDKIISNSAAEDYEYIGLAVIMPVCNFDIFRFVIIINKQIETHRIILTILIINKWRIYTKKIWK